VCKAAIFSVCSQGDVEVCRRLAAPSSGDRRRSHVKDGNLVASMADLVLTRAGMCHAIFRRVVRVLSVV